MKKKLLVLASTYPRWKDDPEPGFVHELCRRLTNQFDVRVICPRAPGAPASESMDGVEIRRYAYALRPLEILVNSGGIVTNLKSSRWKWLLVPGFLLGQLWAIGREVHQWKPDVIHAHWLIPQGILACIAKHWSHKNLSILVTSHGADLYALRARSMVRIKQYVTRQAGHLTVVSKTMVQDLLRLTVDPSKITVAPMGVDLTTRFTPPESKHQRNPREILFVGRLVEKKGLKFLIAAMPEVLKRHPEARLKIVGFGPEEIERKTQVQSLGIDASVTFTGPLPQQYLPEIYRNAAVFVAPFVKAAGGDQEGLGLVLVEASGCGCPVLVSNLDACRDVVDGNPGIRCLDDLDPSPLAQEISSCLDEIEKRWMETEQGRRTLLARFDWQQVAQRYGDILNTMATKQSSE